MCTSTAFVLGWGNETAVSHSSQSHCPLSDSTASLLTFACSVCRSLTQRAPFPLFSSTARSLRYTASSLTRFLSLAVPISAHLLSPTQQHGASGAPLRPSPGNVRLRCVFGPLLRLRRSLAGGDGMTVRRFCPPFNLGIAGAVDTHVPHSLTSEGRCGLVSDRWRRKEGEQRKKRGRACPITTRRTKQTGVPSLLFLLLSLSLPFSLSSLFSPSQFHTRFNIASARGLLSISLDRAQCSQQTAKINGIAACKRGKTNIQ